MRDDGQPATRRFLKRRTPRAAVSWWLAYARYEPRDFLYVAPRRLGCSLFGWHNPTCVGRPAPHPRRW